LGGLFAGRLHLRHLFPAVDIEVDPIENVDLAVSHPEVPDLDH
jgi:hypothetical protein